MDLGPKIPNNEFVENGLENLVLINQTNLRMDSDLERKKKKRVCVGVNRPWQDPRKSVLIYCFSVQLQIASTPVPVFLFPLYTPLLSRSYFTRVYWRVGVDTCPICTFHQFPCSSCKAETYCSSITSTLIRPESQLRAFNVEAAAFPGDTTRSRSVLFICNTYLLIWNGMEGCLCR